MIGVHIYILCRFPSGTCGYSKSGSVDDLYILQVAKKQYKFHKHISYTNCYLGANKGLCTWVSFLENIKFEFRCTLQYKNCCKDRLGQCVAISGEKKKL